MSERGYATIYGDGSATRDFICIDDVVAATMSAAFCEHDLSGEVINIGSGHATSITDIHEMVFEAVQSTMGSVGRPQIIPTRVGDVKNSLADINKAATQLSWFPRNNLSAGISKVVAAQFHSALRHSHSSAGPL
jgi:nucleoside-diphosphate-sugar epimerase